MMLRLFADENVHVDIIASLRKEGFDVITVIEVGLVAHKDYQILEYAEKEKRTLITGDKDFGGLLKAWNLTLPEVLMTDKSSALS